MTRVFMAITGALLLALGVLGALGGSQEYSLLGVGFNGNHNALRVLTGLAALMGAWFGRGISRAVCWAYALGFSALFIGGAAGARALTDAFNLLAGDHVLNLAIATGCFWAVTHRKHQQEEAEDRLELELEMDEGWPEERVPAHDGAEADEPVIVRPGR